MNTFGAKSRLILDLMKGEYACTGHIERFERVRKVVLRARQSQLNFFNTRVLHAVKRCKSVRQTLSSSFVLHEGQWRMFH